MANFAQIIAPRTEDSAGWEAMRFFTYGGMITNLIAAMFSMYAMWMYADFPQRCHYLCITEEDSIPARVAKGELLSEESILDEYKMLQEFGIYKVHKMVAGGAALSTTIGLLLTFMSITTYIWLTLSQAVAGSLMIFIIPGLFGLGYPLISIAVEVGKFVWKQEMAQATRIPLTDSNARRRSEMQFRR